MRKIIVFFAVFLSGCSLLPPRKATLESHPVEVCVISLAGMTKTVPCVNIFDAKLYNRNSGILFEEDRLSCMTTQSIVNLNEIFKDLCDQNEVDCSDVYKVLSMIDKGN